MIPTPLRDHRPSFLFASALALLAVTAGLASVAARAASPTESVSTFPTKPVRFVVPFAPGGSSDVLSRSVGQKLSERWSQPVVVENKPGASTTLAAAQVAKAAPDGYTIMLAPAPFVITQYVYPSLSYDVRKDFVPVSLMVTNPLTVVINPQRIAGRTIGALVDAMKAKPGEMTYGTPGQGSLPHLAVEAFRAQVGTEVVHVPYKGGGPAVVDLLGGQIDFMFASPLEIRNHVESGKLAVLGITSSERAKWWPEVPTLQESGYPGYEAYAWFGVVAPAGTPAEIVGKISADIAVALKSPDLVARLTAQGTDIAASTPAGFGEFLAREHERWSKAVKASGVTVK